MDLELQQRLDRLPEGQPAYVVRLRKRRVRGPDGRMIVERYAERQLVGFGTGASSRELRAARNAAQLEP